MFQDNWLAAEADTRYLWPGQGLSVGVPWSKFWAEFARLQDDRECEQEEEMNNPCLLVRNEWWCVTKINEQMDVLMEEQKAYSDAFNQLPSERRKVMDFVKRLRCQCEEIWAPQTDGRAHFRCASFSD